VSVNLTVTAGQTRAFCLAVLAAVFVWDVLALYSPGRATVSEVLRDWGDDYRVVPAFLAFLMGHAFGWKALPEVFTAYACGAWIWPTQSKGT
jgi:hypothetical protein